MGQGTGGSIGNVQVGYKSLANSNIEYEETFANYYTTFENGIGGLPIYQLVEKNATTYIDIAIEVEDLNTAASFDANITWVIANKANEEKTEVVTIAGKCCESGDLLGEHVKLQKAEIGDTLAVLTTGAYNYSMASHYNRIPNPAVVMVRDGKSRLVVKRETYDDIIKNDL